MNIGPLNHRCRIEQKVTTQDSAYGTEVITWTTLGVAWCGVQDVLPSRSEAVRNGLQMAAQQTRIRMRYRTDIDSSMRIVLDRPTQQVYQIIAGPAVLGANDGIELMVEKYSTAGA